MTPISRRGFLKIAGTYTAGSVLACGCASRPSPATASAVPLSSVEAPMKTETSAPALFLPDRVAYICGCQPDAHNPGGGGNSSLFIGNYCKKSERFLLHWDLSGLSPGLKISRAVMELYCTEIYGTPSGRLIYAPLNSDWGKTVTYNTQPENDAGGQVSMDWPAKKQWHEVDITGIVSAWLAAPEKNYGLIGYAVDVSEDTCSAVFGSIQSLEGVRPRLIIA